jgi:lipopolysaccharide transport system permease protein
MRAFPATPAELVAAPWRHRALIWALARREVAGRYRGSVLGIAWAFFNPLLMLAVYTFVFSEVFKMSWGMGPKETRSDFAIALFTGLIVYGLFSECVGRAPSLVVGNPNYVKKVVFPLEVLPWVALGSSVFHAAVSTVVLLIVQLALRGTLPPTALLFPVVLLPLVLGTMGLSWILASFGVYVRDTGQVVGVFVTVLMFVSPVFYPLSALPVQYRGWLLANPLTPVIEGARGVLVLGTTPDWGPWALSLVLGALLAWAGFWWFQRTRRGFADVL